jgi:hypothetical protein
LFEARRRSVSRLRAPIEATFAFFSDASNLERLTPQCLQFSIVTPPSGGVDDRAFELRNRIAQEGMEPKSGETATALDLVRETLETRHSKVA